MASFLSVSVDFYYSFCSTRSSISSFASASAYFSMNLYKCFILYSVSEYFTRFFSTISFDLVSKVYSITRVGKSTISYFFISSLLSSEASFSGTGTTMNLRRSLKWAEIARNGGLGFSFLVNKITLLMSDSEVRVSN